MVGPIADVPDRAGLDTAHGQHLGNAAGLAVDETGHNQHWIPAVGGAVEYPLLVARPPGDDWRRALDGVLIDDAVGVAVYPHPARVDVGPGAEEVLHRGSGAQVDRGGVGAASGAEVDRRVGC